jgi:hypothetical protein
MRGGSASAGLRARSVEALAQRVQRRAVEAGADLSAVPQLAVGVVRAEQQRAEPIREPRGLGEARDHELLALRALDLEPCARATRDGTARRRASPRRPRHLRAHAAAKNSPPRPAT